MTTAANGEIGLDPIQGRSAVRQVPLTEIRPSPQNEKLYRPVLATDPEVIALAKSIRRHGVKEPLVLSLDGFILSGHRRFVASGLAGLAQATAQTWAGWHRPAGVRRWVKLVPSAPSFGAAWGQLLRRLPATGPGGESVCLPEGRHPDDRPGARRVRRYHELCRRRAGRAS